MSAVEQDTRRLVLEGVYVAEAFECVDCRYDHEAGYAGRVLGELLICSQCLWQVQLECIRSAKEQGINPDDVVVDASCLSDDEETPA